MSTRRSALLGGVIGLMITAQVLVWVIPVVIHGDWRCAFVRCIHFSSTVRCAP